jgi:hypothetical protein
MSLSFSLSIETICFLNKWSYGGTLTGIWLGILIFVYGCFDS